ncbi:AfsR/SARP family transcriptional regulator [Streptomyces sp. WI04-05B]|uniref:AfsR/SARP family transcriptional regulator n=1 Tax=Streptomyces TaxID=1883 RepID=UPI0029A9FF1E|nr:MULTISPECIES: BTAD domain-containing putative transcriptional regulator [unclassified Streptomyces]MDX2547444.1 BTAD domain-containing putative transcriptional regulator [Streptomyces sp. WI04-05B]MDX2586297.1 BTAD domain-containing putative transcriptional regulator [Streptomyces sp. WI04-05A]
MDVRLLGAVELSVRGRTAEVGPPQRRAVLAALAVDTGRPVTVDVLIQRVWGADPPDGARRALHAHIARLRRLCEQTADREREDARLRLLRRSGGYLLEAHPDRVDVHRFRQLSSQARELGRTAEARASMLREALGLWRGEPLAGLDGQWAGRVREAWRQQRVDAAVGWAHLESRTGDPVAVIGPLTELVGEYPLVEPLTGALMRALHAAGRGAEALDRYATVRRRLAEELGADPGTALREAHQSILRGDGPGPSSWPTPRPPTEIAHLAAPPVRRPPTTVPWPGGIPVQLPMGVRGFTGRGKELSRLDEILESALEQPSAVVISAVSGTAGVGKTALAVHWARRTQQAFPDGQLYVNLHGFDPGGPAVGPAEAVRGFLDAFGVPPARVPAGLEAQVGLYRSLLAGRRVLVVLDNARDAEQVRPLLPGAPGCLALVTSRKSLTGLAAAEGAHLLTLGLLGPVEARELLVGRLGADRVTAEPAAVREIVGQCAGLPLALAIVAARATAQSGLPLAALAGELRRADGRLDALDGGEAASQVRAVFSWSYHALGPDAARLFRLLGLHPGPDAALPAVAALADVPTPRARVLLAELVRGHLVTEQVPGRYTFHDLLRAYAAELVAAHDSADTRRRATHRMLDHYLHTAHSADALLTPRPRPTPLPPAQPGAVPEELSDHPQAQAWFAAEHAVLLAAVEQAPAQGFDSHTWRLASALTTYLDRHGYRRALTAVHTTALDAARRRGDKEGQADAHRGLGLAQDRLDRPEEARAHYLRALDLFDQAGGHTGQARIHQHLSRMSEAQGRHHQALGHAHDSLRHHRAAGDRAGQSAALNHIGWILAQLGDHPQALAHCRQALALAQETADLNGQAHIQDSLGYIHHRLGQHPEAVDRYRRALDLFQRTGDRHGEAAGLVCLGDVHHVTAHTHAATGAWTQALAVVTDLGLPDTDPLRIGLLERLGPASAPAAASSSWIGRGPTPPAPGSRSGPSPESRTPVR